MKPRGGASRERQAGFAALLLVLGLLVIGLTTAWTVPVLLRARAERVRLQEIEQMRTLREALETAIARQQVIPSPTGWVDAVASVLGQNTSQVHELVAGTASGAAGRRLLLVDPSLSTSLLPYTQSVAGLTGTLAALDGNAGRMVLVSTTRRDTELPVSQATLNPNSFAVLWSWADGPDHAPPLGWPSTWTGRGDSIFVERLRLSDLFNTITVEGGQVSVNGGTAVDASGGRTLRCLRGGTVRVLDGSGELAFLHTVVRNASFILPGEAHTYFFTGSLPPGSLASEGPSYLSETPPTAATLPNYDPDRDAFAGAMVQKGGDGFTETDFTKIRMWMTTAGGFRVTGEVKLRLFSAMKDFKTDKGGIWDCYLLDVDANGGTRSLIASQSKSRSPWSPGSGSWKDDTINFGPIDHTIASHRRLAVGLVVNNLSDDDQWLAYYTTNFPTAITVTP